MIKYNYNYYYIYIYKLKTPFYNKYIKLSNF